MNSNELLADTVYAFAPVIGSQAAADLATLIIRYGEMHAKETATLAGLDTQPMRLTKDELRHFMANGQDNTPC